MSETIFPVVNKPRTIGSALATSDSTTLAAISVRGMLVGTKCMNNDVGAYFTLTTSNAALVTDQIVEVKDTVGARWIKDVGGDAVASVTATTSNAVNNADPTNPIINNASGSNAGTMSAAAFTKLAGLPGPWTTVGPTVGDSQDLTIATGIDGDADGGYEVRGWLAALAGGESFFLRPNNVDAACYSATVIGVSGAVPGLSGANLRIISASATDTPVFRCTIEGDTSHDRMFLASGAEASDPASNITVGAMQGSTNITSLVIHGSSADSIKEGSVFAWRKLNGS